MLPDSVMCRTVSHGRFTRFITTHRGRSEGPEGEDGTKRVGERSVSFGHGQQGHGRKIDGRNVRGDGRIGEEHAGLERRLQRNEVRSSGGEGGGDRHARGNDEETVSHGVLFDCSGRRGVVGVVGGHYLRSQVMDT